MSDRKVILLLKDLAVWGSIVLIISNGYLLYSFIRGNTILTDLNIRVAIEVDGAKETVSKVVLTPFVYIFNLYFVRNESSLLKKIIYVISIFLIYATLVITNDRGQLVTIILLSIAFISMFSSTSHQIVTRFFGIFVLFLVFYLVVGSVLANKGYDPIQKLIHTIEFSMDTKNPEWDKGRSIPREFALDVWRRHLWLGVGYDDLYHQGLDSTISTSHNFIITSLFHRGIIGTIIYLLILSILYLNSIKLWYLLKKDKNYQNDMLKMLIVVSAFWLIPFWTQEMIWEKYSLSVQFIYFGLLTNTYSQIYS